MNKIIPLRAHHALCLQNFRGKGYDAAFIRNMEAIAGLLKENPETRLTLCMGLDEICGACPNRKGAQCRSDPKPSQFDETVLALCGLRPGQKIIWGHLQKQVLEKVVQEGKLGLVCGQCQWYPMCAQYVENSVENVENIEENTNGRGRK